GRHVMVSVTEVKLQLSGEPGRSVGDRGRTVRHLKQVGPCSFACHLLPPLQRCIGFPVASLHRGDPLATTKDDRRLLGIAPLIRLVLSGLSLGVAEGTTVILTSPDGAGPVGEGRPHPGAPPPSARGPRRRRWRAGPAPRLPRGPGSRGRCGRRGAG